MLLQRLFARRHPLAQQQAFRRTLASSSSSNGSNPPVPPKLSKEEAQRRAEDPFGFPEEDWGTFSGAVLQEEGSPEEVDEFPPEFVERWARYNPPDAPPPAPPAPFPPTPTLVYMDIETKPLGKTEYSYLGRVVFSLFTHIAPKTCENFRQLCVGKSEKAFAERGDKIPLHYKHSPIHRVIPGFIVQGGDFTLRNGYGGESIYGPRFADESFARKHDEALLLGMSNVGPNTNASQFYVTLQPAQWLDGLNVVFGKVIKGANVIKAVEQMGSADERDDGKLVGGKVRIARCGQLVSPDSEEETDVKVGPVREVQEATVIVEEQVDAATPDAQQEAQGESKPQ